MTPEDRTRLGLPHSTFSHSFAPINPGRRVCPVCKASTSVASLVPIYVRSNDSEEEVITTSNNDNSNTEPSPAKRARQTEETTTSAIDGIDDVGDLPDSGTQAETTGRTTTDQPIETDAVGTEMDARSESTNGLRQRYDFVAEIAKYQSKKLDSHFRSSNNKIRLSLTALLPIRLNVIGHLPHHQQQLPQHHLEIIGARTI